MSRLNTTSIFLCTGVVAFAHYTYSTCHATERDFDQMTFYPSELMRGSGRRVIPACLTCSVNYFTFRAGKDLQERIRDLAAPWLLPLFDERNPAFTVMVYDTVHGVFGWQATRFGDTLALVPIRPRQVYGFLHHTLIPDEVFHPPVQKLPKPHWAKRFLRVA